MNKLFPILAALLMLTISFAPAQGWALQAFTTDAQEVPLRAGGSSKHRTIAKIPPSTAVEVLKQPDWTQVRYTDPNGEVKEGWVGTSLLTFQPPESVALRELRTENKGLREQAESTEREKQELARTQEELTGKYAKLEAEYEALKAGSANYVQLKEESDALKNSLAEARQNFQTLLQENDSLKFSSQIRIFAAGAGVLLVGLFIGWTVGKQLRRRRSNYFM
jgi:SH3 domain protein